MKMDKKSKKIEYHDLPLKFNVAHMKYEVDLPDDGSDIPEDKIKINIIGLIIPFPVYPPHTYAFGLLTTGSIHGILSLLNPKIPAHSIKASSCVPNVSLMNG